MREIRQVLAACLALMGVSSTTFAVPLNEQPMYGSQAKSPEMKAADEQFIANAAKLGYNRAQASDKSVQLGWQYFFQRHDIATAMKRFNQAWMADPENGDSFHGFAILVMERDKDAAQADGLFQQGIAKPRQSPGIWLDYGRFLLDENKPSAAVPILRKALTFSNMGPDAEALLALALFQSGDVTSACAEREKVLDTAQQPVRDAARQLKCAS